MTTLRLTAAFLAMLASMSVSFAGGTLNLLPPVSPQYSPTMIVQAAQIQHSKSKAVGDRTIGVCYLVENRGSGLDPVRGLENYFRFVEHKDINAVGIPNIQIAQKPAHGQITYYKSGYTYEPSNGYEGRDRVTFVIEANVRIPRHGERDFHGMVNTDSTGS